MLTHADSPAHTHKLFSHHTVDSLPLQSAKVDPRKDNGKGRHSLTGWSGLLRTRMQKRHAAVRRGDAGSGWAYFLGFPEEWEFA